MFGLTFLNPWMWAGMLMVAIPIVVHLFTRRTPVVFVFPTLRFLQKAKASQSRIFRIRHILLMLIRIGIIAMLVLAFTRPIHRTGALAQDNVAEGNTVAIIILDATLSMGYSGSGVSPMSQGKSAAVKILDFLPNSDLANVIVVGAYPQPMLEEPKQSHQVLVKDIEKVEYTPTHGDFGGALTLAVQQLLPFEGYEREIHIVSDFQRSNWSAVEFSVIPSEIKTVFVSVSDEDASNFMVSDVRLSPARPKVGESVELTCKVANYSKAPAQIPLECQLEGQDTLKRIVEVQPGTTNSVSFRLRMNEVGITEGQLHIQNDGLNEDNVRYFTIPVAERLNVTLLTDEPPTLPGAAHRFVGMALDPFGDERSTMNVAVMKPDDFDAVTASKSDLVMLVGVEALSATTGKDLVKYLEDGGSVAYFLSGPLDRGNLALLSKTEHGGVEMPVTLEGWNQADDQGSYAVLHEANYDAPLLRKFRESGDLAKLFFYRYFNTKRIEAQGQVLLRYDDGNVALALKSAGLGTFMLANFSPHPAHSDMVKHPVFVPLMHEIVQAMRPKGDSGRDFFVGQPCSTTVPFESEDTQFRFTNPTGKEINASVEIGQNDAIVMMGSTEELGFYRIHDAESRVGSVAVNVNSKESNLEALSLKELEELSKASKSTFYGQQGASASALLTLREGTPLWHYLLLMGMVLLMVEQMFALVWKR